jgi:formyl-CoA transferase
MPSAELLERLGRAGVPAAPVQDVSEVVAHPQTEALGLLQQLPHEQVRDLRLVALPMSLGGERLGHRLPPPACGEHTVAILLDAGYSEGEVDGLRARGVVAD